MSDEIPVRKLPEEQKKQTGGLLPKVIEAYGAAPEISQDLKLVKVTLTTLDDEVVTVVSLPLSAFQKFMKKGRVALREKGLDPKSLRNMPR